MFPYKSSFFEKSPRELLETLKNVDDSLVTVSTVSDEIIEIKSNPNAYESVNIITDLYTESARVHAKIYGLLSPYEYWIKYQERIKEFAMQKYGNTSLYALRESIYFSCKEATTFSPLLSKCIYDYFIENTGNVLDPFSGWGDRAIGAIASPKVKSYQGVDCNKALIPGYTALKNELDDRSKIDFCISTFEDFKTDQKYDLIFTSPPFFDFEIYSSSLSQSITGHDTYKSWFNKWAKAILRKMVNLLSENGTLILHIVPTHRSPKFYDDTKRFLENECYMDFYKNIMCSNGKKTFSISAWKHHSR